jgi:hypothetical protein
MTRGEHTTTFFRKTCFVEFPVGFAILVISLAGSFLMTGFSANTSARWELFSGL